ncbi:glycosyltransferase, partial [Myxococcota bacterium]|nr:glycosyltransferase [Myxococcota bacterium]
ARNQALVDFARRAALRLAPSRHLAALAEALGLGPVEVLPHGTRPHHHRPAPAERAGPFLFLGTIAAHKGPDLVVRAWRRAFPDGQPALALHGPVQDARLALGHPLGGPLSRAGVRRALEEARALVIGSTWPENQPLVALEARAAGCPVLAPAVGGLPEVVQEGRDGWLYPAGDEQRLAALMRRAVEAPLSAPPAPPPDLDAQVEALLRRYRRVLAGAHP